MYILLWVQLPANNTIFIAVIILLHAIKNIYLYETYTALGNISKTLYNMHSSHVFLQPQHGHNQNFLLRRGSKSQNGYDRFRSYNKSQLNKSPY